MPCYDLSKLQTKGRTSRVVVFLRTWLAATLVLWFISSSIENIGGDTLNQPSNFWMCLFSALFMICSTWCGSVIVHGLIKLGDPWYAYYRSRGWSPFWDSLPWPINPDTDGTRLLGLREPNYKELGFTPPPHWLRQCPICGARMERGRACWNCNYGADGDYSACHQRFGITPDSHLRHYHQPPSSQPPDFPFPS